MIDNMFYVNKLVGDDIIIDILVKLGLPKRDDYTVLRSKDHYSVFNKKDQFIASGNDFTYAIKIWGKPEHITEYGMEIYDAIQSKYQELADKYLDDYSGFWETFSLYASSEWDKMNMFNRIDQVKKHAEEKNLTV